MSKQPEKPWGAWLFKLFAFSGHPNVIRLLICVSISIGYPPYVDVIFMELSNEKFWGGQKLMTYKSSPSSIALEIAPKLYSCII